MAEMQKIIDSLTGKDNKKERTAKSKEPANGFFVVKSAEPEKEAEAPTAAEEAAATQKA